jgi:photosystem II stability/assembly factor-like uncharacterized protein
MRVRSTVSRRVIAGCGSLLAIGVVVIIATRFRPRAGAPMTARADPDIDAGAARDARSDAHDVVSLESARFDVTRLEASRPYPPAPELRDDVVWFSVGSRVVSLSPGDRVWRSFACPAGSDHLCDTLGGAESGDMWLLGTHGGEFSALFAVRSADSIVEVTPPRLRRYGTVSRDGPASVFAITADEVYSPTIVNFHVTEDGGAHWVERTMPSGPDPGIPFVAYYEEKDAHANMGDRLYTTSDGGRTWRAAPIPSGADVEFRTVLDGFLVASPGGLQRTVDGGRTWTTVVLSGPDPIAPPKFSTGEPDDGSDVRTVMLSQTMLHRTRDGGATWVATSLPVEGLLGEGDGLRFLGWEHEHTDHLRVTSDGGVTWKTVPLPLPAEGVDRLSFYSNRPTWLVLVTLKDTERVLMRSDDDGDSFRLLPAPR